MPIQQSKLRVGTLTLQVGAAAAVDFATQVTNVRITPSYDEEGDRLRTLSGDQLNPDTSASYVLAINAIQDFEDSAGLMHYLWTNELEDATFVWTTGPAADDGMQWTGVVQLRIPETGGDVDSRLTTELEMPCTSKPTGPTAVV